MNARVKNCVKDLNLTEEDAKKMIRSVDEARDNYHMLMPASFHLTLSIKISWLTAVYLVLRKQPIFWLILSEESLSLRQYNDTRVKRSKST